MGLCSGPSTPDNSAQLAEQQREFDIAQAQAKQQHDADVAAAQAQHDADQKAAQDAALAAALQAGQQKAADDTVAKAQSDAAAKQSADQAAAQQALVQKQIDSQNSIAAQQEAERQADLVRQQQQQDAAAATAKATADKANQDAATKAANATTYSTGAQKSLADATNTINSTYSKYDDNYYNNFASQFMQYYEPQINDQFTKANNSTTYALNDAGNLNSSGAAYTFGQIAQQKANTEASVASQALASRDALKNQVTEQQKAALNSATTAVSTAAPPDFSTIDNVNGSLGGLNSSLSNITNASAPSIATPTYSNLGDVFSSVALKPSGKSAGIAGTSYNTPVFPTGSSSLKIV